MKRLLVVAGSGRSGTSVMAATLGQLGFHVPQPEVAPDETNPNGFGEPQWAVDFHTELLREINVHASDARPAAWALVAKQCLDEGNLERVGRWLGEQFSSSDHVVVKDPRLLWFLPLWARASAAAGGQLDVITMLRHPAEVVRSKSRWYPKMDISEANRLAGWVNTMLLTERGTRDRGRLFVQFADILDDWTQQVGRISSELDLPMLVNARARDQASVDAFVDRSLYRSRATWEDIHAPRELRELAEQIWDDLCQLGEDSDSADAIERLDKAREQYLAMYQDAEAFAESSVLAQVRPLKRELNQLRKSERRLQRQLRKARSQLRQLEESDADSNAEAHRTLPVPRADAFVVRLSRRVPERFRRRLPLRIRRVVFDRFRT